MDKKIKQLQDELAQLTESCAYMKLDENENLEYIRIDDQKFTNPEKMGDQIIEQARNMHKAVEIMHKYNSLDELPKAIPDFVIKYHPTWISLRQATGYLDEYAEEGEIALQKEKEYKTYKEWMNEVFLAVGEKEYYPKNLDPNALIERQVFEKLIRPEVEATDGQRNMQEYYHHDTSAFILTTRWKNLIDHPEFDKTINFKGVGYKLDKDSHFPVIVIGSNNKRKIYDFRKDGASFAFYKRLSIKNPKNKALKNEVKKLELVLRRH